MQFSVISLNSKTSHQLNLQCKILGSCQLKQWKTLNITKRFCLSYGSFDLALLMLDGNLNVHACYISQFFINITMMNYISRYIVYTVYKIRLIYFNIFQIYPHIIYIYIYIYIYMYYLHCITYSQITYIV